MTSEVAFQYSLHKRLWLWLEHNPENSKGDWPEWITLGHTRNLCFACHYADTIRKTYVDALCSYCPLNWPDGVSCFLNNSLYKAWEQSQSPVVREHLAGMIARLPVKEGVAWI